MTRIATDAVRRVEPVSIPVVTDLGGVLQFCRGSGQYYHAATGVVRPPPRIYLEVLYEGGKRCGLPQIPFHSLRHGAATAGFGRHTDGSHEQVPGALECRCHQRHLRPRRRRPRPPGGRGNEHTSPVGQIVDCAVHVCNLGSLPQQELLKRQRPAQGPPLALGRVREWISERRRRAFRPEGSLRRLRDLRTRS
jgi:hypothetical protein